MKHRTDQIAIGNDIIGADGATLGKVAQVYPGYIVVEKGFFFPTDYYIPLSTVRNSGDGQIHLAISKDESLQRGWDRLPDDLQMEGIGDTMGAMLTTGSVASRLEAEVDPSDRVAITTRIENADEIRLPLQQEELTATVRPVQGGDVRVSRSVVTERRVANVAIADEQIRVRRRLVDRNIDPTVTTPFEEIVIEIPLRPEEFNALNESRADEELVVTRQTVQRIERVSGAVRREEVFVDDDTRVIDPESSVQ